MTPCTLWFRRTPLQSASFNHLENGHVTGRPTVRHEAHRIGWRGGEWEPMHAWLTDDNPPRVVFYSPEEA